MKEYRSRQKSAFIVENPSLVGESIVEIIIDGNIPTNAMQICK